LLFISSEERRKDVGEKEDRLTIPASSPSTRRSPAPGALPSGGELMDHIWMYPAPLEYRERAKEEEER